MRCLLIQDKYWGCVGLFNDWAVRSGLEPLVERVPAQEALRPGESDLVAIRDRNGDVRMPSGEMIVDFLLQVSRERRRRRELRHARAARRDG